MKDDQYIREGYMFAQAEQQNWWSLYRRCYLYAMPNRNNFQQMQSGQQKDIYVYDSTAVLATRTFVAKTQDAITPIGINWCTLKAGAMYKPQDVEKMNESLQILSNMMFEQLRNSNFDSCSAESYYDLAAGTGALFIKERPGEDVPFWFESVSQYLIKAFENSLGLLTNVYRDYKFIKFYQLKKRFPHVKFPKYVMQAAKENPFQIFPLVEAWIDNENGTFTNVVGGEDLSEIYYKSIEKSSPWILFRWSKLPGESYGRGPLLDVMGDIKSLNKLMENSLKQVELTVNPPYLCYADFINPSNVLMQPGAMIPARSMGGTQHPLQPLYTPGDFHLGEWAFQDMRDKINRGMYANPIGSMNDPTKTATEIQLRQELYVQETGPAFGRLQQEYLNPLIKRLIYILVNQGKFPKDAFPDEKWTSISYESPLIENQKMQEVKNITAFAQIMDQLAGPQSTVSVIDVPSAVKKLEELNNVPTGIVKSQAQIMQMMQQQQQAAQQQQQAQMQQQMQQQQNSPNIPQGPSVLPGSDNGQ